MVNRLIMSRVAKISGMVLFGAAVVVLPIVAISNSLKFPTSFDNDKIGVYVERSWKPTYEKAIKKYYEKHPDHKYKIQLLELGSFDAVDLIDKLGYADQKVADIIYMPVDRIPRLVENSAALMGFKSVDEIISNEFDSSIYDGYAGGKEEFAKKGEALVIPPESPEGTAPEPFYFGIPHATEALVCYYKGFSDSEIKSIWNIGKIVNENQWSDSMFSLKFNDLWYGLGAIAGFIQAEAEMNGVQGAGYNGQLIGKTLVSKNSSNWNSSKYQSNMVNIDGGTTPLEDYKSTVGWNDKGVSIDTNVATSALRKVLDFLAAFYHSTKVRNNLLGVDGNDWLLEGNDFNPNTEKMIKDERTKKALTIDGPWMIGNYTGKFDKAIPVPKLISKDEAPGAIDIPYLQAPGGWLYAINQRNATNMDKVKDIKRFLNILLTDDELIVEQYTQNGKMVEGSKGKELLLKFATEKGGLEGDVINAVFNTKRMDQRPDGGNAEFGQVWGSWDEKGFRENNETSGPSTKTTLVGWTTRNYTLQQVQEKLRKTIVTSFDAMLNGLSGK